MDTLGEWSDGDDQWIMDVDVPGERNDRLVPRDRFVRQYGNARNVKNLWMFEN